MAAVKQETNPNLLMDIPGHYIYIYIKIFNTKVERDDQNSNKLSEF
jgi:hypothetical protein